jgi:MFS family permease
VDDAARGALFAAACLVTASAQNWFMLVAGFAMLRMLGPGALAFLSGNTLPFWFDRRLGLVEGFRQLSLAAAMGVVPALNLWLANHFGWRGAYALLGGGLGMLLFPAFALLFRNRPEDVGQELDGARPNAETPGAVPDWSAGLTLGETLRAPAFWIAASATALFGLILTAMFFSLVPIFHERGLSDLEAASMVTFFAISLAAWQLAGGALADRLPAAWLMAAALAGLAAGMFALRAADSLLAAQLAGLVIGGAQGLFFGGTQPLWARYFGRLHLGKIRGVLMTVTVAASSLGPLLAGLARDHFGNFDLVLLLFALAPLPLAALALFARPPQVPARPTAARA